MDKNNRFRFAMALVSGVLLALAFPGFDIAGFAWVMPGVLLFAAIGASPGSAFRIGYAGGFAFYLTQLYWLLHIPVKYLPIAGWMALSAYLALYPAIWVWLGWKFFLAGGEEGTAPANPFSPSMAAFLFQSAWVQRAFWCLSLAALWVALEMVLGRFLSGFPWDFLGVSQYRQIPLIQVSAYTGVYGVSFLVIWFSTALLCGGMGIVLAGRRSQSWVAELVLPGLAVALVVAAGFRYVRAQEPLGPTVRIGLIQPSIPQTLIWDPAESEGRFKQLVELTEKALAEKPQIVVWPEASVPNMIRHHEETARAVIELVRKHKVWAIVGSDDAEMRPDGSQTIDYFNSAFAISPEGELMGNYRKRRLVIFGEYMPFAEELPFLRNLSPAGPAGFKPGQEARPFILDDLEIETGILICFEDTFPHLVPEYVGKKTDFLVNLTNNGWFGESAAQWQHAATAVFRAVENRVPLVRAANNGLSCWVDRYGAMHSVFYPGSRDIYGSGFKIVEVPVLPPGGERTPSFYNQHGDVFGWGCVGITLVNIGAAGLRGRFHWRKPRR